MTGHWPFKKPKPDLEASSSRTKYKLPPLKKWRDRPYLNIAMARATYRDNTPWLSSDWLLNSRRMLVPLVPCHGRERHDEIHHQAILPPDLREDPAFSMESTCSDRLA
jgi:hypothetical protein